MTWGNHVEADHFHHAVGRGAYPGYARPHRTDNDWTRSAAPVIIRETVAVPLPGNESPFNGSSFRIPQWVFWALLVAVVLALLTRM